MNDKKLLNPSLTPTMGPQRRLIAECTEWSIAEYVCTAGPDDRSFEEEHDSFTMAAVVEGTFRYKTNAGSSLMHPGSWLLGNHGECFSCGHDHSRGDRCVSIHVSPQYFAEVASSCGVAGQFRFDTPLLPAKVSEFSLLAHVCSIANGLEQIEIDEAVTSIIERIIAQISGEQPLRRFVSARDERRISAIVHHLEDNFLEVINLGELSALAAMSKYHFLRTFNALVGRSPYQYLLNLRLQCAAQGLINSNNSIADLSANSGFGDLSTFGAQFKRQFGETPSKFRARYRSSSGTGFRQQ